MTRWDMTVSRHKLFKMLEQRLGREIVRGNYIAKDYSGMIQDIDVQGRYFGIGDDDRIIKGGTIVITAPNKFGGCHHPCKHRVFVQCPKCKQAIPIGRLHQHYMSQKCIDRSKVYGPR